MRERLTRALIENTQPGTADIVIRDTEVPGLIFRVTPNGVKSLLVRYRLGKGRGAPVRQPKIPIDPTKVGAIEQARRVAREWREKGANGIDVHRELRKEAEAPTVEKLCTEYVERHGKDKRSASEDIRRIAKLPKRLLRSRLKDVTVHNIQDLHRSMSSVPYEANRVLSLLSKMFSLAISWRWIETNPAIGVPRFEEEKRERFLTQEEIQRLDDALSDYAADRGDVVAQEAADAIRLLLLTGCRSGELLAATWDQFDLEAGAWRKPSSHTKTKKVHRVSLSTAAVEILEGIRARRDIPGKFVFPGKNGTHRQSLKAAWADIRIRAKIEDVRIHDLRHTAASLMLSAGVPLDIVGRVLGHTQAQTTLRYAHLTDEAGKDATDRLSNIVGFGKKRAT